MKHSRSAGLLLLSVLLTASLSCFGDEITVAGTLTMTPAVEGPCWTINTSDGTRYLPVGWPGDNPKVDGHQVEVTGRIMDNLDSFTCDGHWIGLEVSTVKRA